MKRLERYALAAVCLVACADPKADKPPSSSTATGTSASLRLDLSHNNATDEVSLLAIEIIATTELTSSYGPYLAAGYNDNTLVVARYVPFAQLGYGEIISGGELSSGAQIELETTTATVFVPQVDGMDRIDILDANGAVALTIDELPAPSATSLGQIRQAASTCTAGSSAEYADLRQLYPYIRFIEDACEVSDPDISWQMPNPAGGSPLTVQVARTVGPSELSPALLTAFKDALAALPDKLRKSIPQIRWVEFANAYNWDGFTLYGNNYLLLNFATLKDTPQLVQQILVHEAAHAYQHLIDGDTSLATFPADLQQAITALGILGVEQSNPRTLHNTWNRLITDGKKILNTAAYDSIYADANLDPNAMADSVSGDAFYHANAFARQYGRTSVWDDLATHVEIFYSGGSITQHPYCQQLQTLDGTLIPSRYTLQLAKLNILWTAQFIDDALYWECTGNNDPADSGGEGFALGLEDEDSTGLHPSPYAKAGVETYKVESGETYKVLLYQAKVDDDWYRFNVRYPKLGDGYYPNPIGYYPLDPTGGPFTPAVWARNAFIWTDEDGEYGDDSALEGSQWKISMDTSDGYILITRASATCIVGFMYNADLWSSITGVSEQDLKFSWFRKGCDGSGKPTNQY